MLTHTHYSHLTSTLDPQYTGFLALAYHHEQPSTHAFACLAPTLADAKHRVAQFDRATSTTGLRPPLRGGRPERPDVLPVRS